MYIKDRLSSQFSSRIFAFLLLLLFLFTTFYIVKDVTAEETPPTTHVVIINSYHQGFKWTDEITSAVISAMSAELDNIDFHVEYMDSKRHPEKQFREIFYKSIAPKYKSFRPSIIITSDDNALDFVKRYHRDLFPAIPVIFCGVNKISNALSVDRNHFSGLIETLDIVANIELAQRLLPEVEEIVIVSDGTTTGLGTRQMALEAEQEHQHIDFTYLNGEDLSTEQMLESLEKLGKYSAVLVPAWYLDKDGNTFDNTKIYPRIAKASVVPVFGTSSANLGLGIVGGKLNSGSIQGEYAAHQALRILSGEASIKNLPVETTSQNKYMFDHAQLSRFGISKRSLPPGSMVFNRPIPFYERYKTESIVILTAFILLVSIIALLLWNIRRRQKVEQDLIDQKQLAEQYFNIAGVMLIVIDSQSRIVLANRKTIEVLGYTENDLLGKEWMKVCLLPSEYSQAKMQYKDLLDGKIQPFECIENYTITKQGEKRLIAWKNVLLKDSGGKITGILTSGEDITERSNMEISLKESEERFRTLHEASFGGIVIHDKGEILDCNQGLSEITGYSIEELIGMDGLQLIAPQWREMVMQSMQGSSNVRKTRNYRAVYA
jgi:PAS domain S-box-containing protein